tara:strand:+ start:2032 stop:2211 length:180 start_codon:yes stop_codon:yes gene_type:complete
MKLIFILLLLLLFGCPKKDMKTLDEIEKERELEELLEELNDEESELWDTLPEREEDETD